MRREALALALASALSPQAADGVVELGTDRRAAEGCASLLRLAVDPGAASDLVITRRGSSFVIDAARLRAARKKERNLDRLIDVAASERRVLVRLVPVGHRPAGRDPMSRQRGVSRVPLSFPTAPGRTLPARLGPDESPPELLSRDPAVDEVLAIESPSGCAVTTLAHELLTHVFRAFRGEASEHVSPDDATARDADDSEAAARRNFEAARVIDGPARSRAHERLEEFVVRSLAAVPAVDRPAVEKILRARHDERDWIELAPVEPSSYGSLPSAVPRMP